MSELLPCPHCSHDAQPVCGAPNNGHYILCVGCNATTCMCATRDLAIEKWNRRSAPASSPTAEDYDDMLRRSLNRWMSSAVNHDITSVEAIDGIMRDFQAIARQRGEGAK